MTTLAEVLEKLERVVALVANMSPGPLTVYDANDGDGWPPRPLWCFMNPGYEDEDPDAIVLQGSIHYGGKEDADAIAAAINFLQEHGPALLRDAGDGWKSPFGPCVCMGMNQCPGCNPDEAIAMAREIATAEERRRHPPCEECGAMTAAEAEAMCHCSGDKDDCHGCSLWDDAAMHAPGGD